MSMGGVGAAIAELDKLLAHSHLLPTAGILLCIVVLFPAMFLLCKGQVIKSIETLGHSLVAFLYFINPFSFVIGIRRTWHIWVATVLTSSENANAQ